MLFVLCNFLSVAEAVSVASRPLLFSFLVRAEEIVAPRAARTFHPGAFSCNALLIMVVVMAMVTLLVLIFNLYG